MLLSEFKSRLERRFSAYKKDERGTFTIFIAFTFLTMVVAAGFAWDVIRYEAMRTHVQLAIDNAALAAAALDQQIDPETGEKLDPESVANDYLAAIHMPYDVEFDPVAEINTATERKVNISAVADLNTYFLTVAGQKSMRATVLSSAYEKNAKVEISLVLDISGSMGSPTKIGSLITGAQNFVTSMLAANTSSEPNIVSINLIPYSTYVNVGPDLFEELGVTPQHSQLDNARQGYCVSFNSGAYSDTDFPTSGEMEFATVFGYTNYYNYDGLAGHYSSSPYCTTQEWAQIRVMSNNATELNAQIGAFQATTQTSIDDAVKWGSALLDPSANTAVQALAGLPNGSSQKVDSGFSDRPASYDSEETNKILVVMTDGVNTTQYNMKSNYNSSDDTPPAVWYREDLTGDGVITYTMPLNLDIDGDGEDDWTQLNWPELWSIETVRDYITNTSQSDQWYTYMDYSRTGSQKNNNLDNICSAAKNEGVKIYTIAYEASSSSAQTMLDCSSGENYAYTATESDIGEIFSNIGSGIKKLQLVD